MLKEIKYCIGLLGPVLASMYGIQGKKIKDTVKSEVKAAPDYKPHQIAKSIQYKPLSIISRIGFEHLRGCTLKQYGCKTLTCIKYFPDLNHRAFKTWFK